METWKMKSPVKFYWFILSFMFIPALVFLAFNVSHVESQESNYEMDQPQVVGPSGIKLITEIPKKYNDDFGALLRDFQAGSVSQSEVIQFLILWNDKSMFLALSEVDVQTDLILVDKQMRERIQAYKKSIYQRK